MLILRTILIGGGYLVWLLVKEGKSVWRSIFDPNQT